MWGWLGAREGRAGPQSKEAESRVGPPCFHADQAFRIQVLEWRRFSLQDGGGACGAG